MDSNHPKDIALADSLYNLDQMVVISHRVKEFLETLALPQIEFLRVFIVDHQGRIASPTYFILHPTWVIDGIDKKKSVLDWNLINKDVISNCNTLFLDPSKVPSDAKMFRLKHLYYPILVRADVVQQIEEQRFSGTIFRTFDDFVC